MTEIQLDSQDKVILRVPRKFHLEAKRIGKIECRSAVGQTLYWAAIGMAVTQDPEALKYLRERGLFDA